MRLEIWWKMYVAIAANAIFHYTFSKINAEKPFAAHISKNTASRGLFNKLGFVYIGDEFYATTGLSLIVWIIL